MARPNANPRRTRKTKTRPTNASATSITLVGKVRRNGNGRYDLRPLFEIRREQYRPRKPKTVAPRPVEPSPPADSDRPDEAIASRPVPSTSATVRATTSFAAEQLLGPLGGGDGDAVATSLVSHDTPPSSSSAPTSVSPPNYQASRAASVSVPRFSVSLNGIR